MPDFSYVVISDGFDHAYSFLSIENALGFIKDQLSCGYSCQIMEVRKGE